MKKIFENGCDWLFTHVGEGLVIFITVFFVGFCCIGNKADQRYVIASITKDNTLVNSYVTDDVSKHPWMFKTKDEAVNAAHIEANKSHHPTLVIPIILPDNW